VLADMRQALGGDAAITAVQAFSVSGSESHNFDGNLSSLSIEWTAVLPDRFVRVRRLSMPIGADEVTTDGFRGDSRIRRHVGQLPVPPDPFQGDTPDQRTAREARSVRNLKREFSRVTVALGMPAADPLDVSYEAQRTVGGKVCDVLRFRASDGYTATLAVDAATHLPVMVSWMAAPIVTYSTSTVMAIAEGGRPTSAPLPPTMPLDFPIGDPTAGLPPVEHQILFDKFTLADGLNWPHRFVERVGDRVWTTTEVGKFKLNPKIDQKLFDPTRR